MIRRFTIDQMRQKLVTSFPTTDAAAKVLEKLGIVTELTGQRRSCS